MSLTALTLRYACDLTSRVAMSPFDGLDGSRIYLGNPVNVQAAMFSGVPAAVTLISDLDSNVTTLTFIIRKTNALGELICMKEVDTATALVDEFNASLTFEQWKAATSQHVQFRLGVLDTNVAVPSCGSLEYYAGIAANTSAGPILCGFFKGYFVDDGVAVWVVGVTATGAPVLFFRLVDSYVGSLSSIESINGNLLSNGTVAKFVIDESGSEWTVVKPATEVTNVDAGIIRLLDNTAHLERNIGL